MKNALTLLFVILSASFVTACGASEIFQEQVPPSCPTLKPLQNGEKVVRYKPGVGRDITDVILEAEFTQFDGECQANEELVEVGVSIGMKASKGPALEGDLTKVGVILAITDLDKKIIDQSVFDVTLDFSGNRSTISYFERFLIDIPLKEGVKSDEFNIYLTFALSPEEMDFNKKSKRY